MYRVVYKKTAIKAMARMPKGISSKMIDTLELIAEDPRAYQGDWKQLSGSPYWRLRVGGYRAVCDLQKNQLVLLVVKAGPRGDV
ncbi:MAG: type II toxin-antitoxin system RelE/ParE family toxin [Sedimenticolaceae bacterium]